MSRCEVGDDGSIITSPVAVALGKANSQLLDSGTLKPTFCLFHLVLMLLVITPF